MRRLLTGRCSPKTQSPVRRRLTLRWTRPLMLMVVLAAAMGVLTNRVAAADPAPAQEWTPAVENDPQPPKLPNPPIDINRSDKRCVINVDILMLLDSSNSIADADWQSELRIVQEVAQRYVGTGARLGVISYGSSGFTRADIPLARGNDLGFIAQRLFEMRGEQSRGSTNIDEALQVAETEILSQPRVDVLPIVVVLGDFFYTSGEDPAPRAARLKSDYRMSLFGLMVGSEVNQALADAITGPPPGVAEVIPYFVRAESWSAALASGLSDLTLFLCPAPSDHAILTSPAAGKSLPSGPVTIEWVRPTTRACVAGYIVEVFTYPSLPEERVFATATASLSVVWDRPPTGNQTYIIRISTRFCNGVSQPFDWYVHTCSCPTATPQPARTLDLALQLSADPSSGRSRDGRNPTPFTLNADVSNLGNTDGNGATLIIRVRGNRTDSRLQGPLRSDATAFFEGMGRAQQTGGPGTCTARDTSQATSAPFVPSLEIQCQGVNVPAGAGQPGGPPAVRLSFRLLFPVDAQYNQIIHDGTVAHPQDGNPGNNSSSTTVEILRG